MRRLFVWIMGLALASAVGCHHNTCDDCNYDICGGCGHGRMYIVPAVQSPPKAPENIEKMPQPKQP